MGRAGLKQVADELGIALADFDKGRTVSHKDALLIKSFVIANGVLDSDGLVNLPKLKTHPLVRFTGAIKNQFGCIPGLLKSQYHVKLPDPYDFATMLVDLNTLTKPRFCVMDGVVAMEGNGPRSGKLTNLNVLLFSSDPVALDATACRVINLDPEVVPTAGLGEKAGLGTYRAGNIEIVGDSIESLIDGGFDIIRTPPDHCGKGRLRTFIKNRLCERPAIDKTKCTNCGECVKMCPVQPKAVHWRGSDDSKPPAHDYDLCIRCYCCQESCPEGAVFVQSPLMGRVLYPR
jgi:NAD-dependent dihydropyrimidine dehydrogenase PreA subunit